MNFVWIFKKLLKILKMRTNSNFLQKSANSKREGIFKYLQISNCKVDFCKKIASSKRESEFSNICKFQSLKFWILSEYLKNCNDLWKTKTSVCGTFLILIWRNVNKNMMLAPPIGESGNLLPVWPDLAGSSQIGWF